MKQNIKIASFNVNSIRARCNHLINWLKEENIHIALIQELKTLENNFDWEEIRGLGYNIFANYQKTYNGVAILSKFRLEDCINYLLPSPDHNINQQARYVEAVVTINQKTIRISSVYVPNGGSEANFFTKIEESEKFKYKLEFFDFLTNHLKNNLSKFGDEIQIIGGDFNVANGDIDVFNPAKLENSVCFHPLEQEKFRTILNYGFFDCYRLLNPHEQEFSWFDYRGNSFAKNYGLRIDYLLSNANGLNNLTMAKIDFNPRKQEKPSDHCPVIINLSL